MIRWISISNMINGCYVILANRYISDANKLCEINGLAISQIIVPKHWMYMYKVHTITSNPFLRLNAPAVVGKPFNSIIHHFHSPSDDVSTTQQISFEYFHTNLYCETIFPRFIYAHSDNNHISKLDRVSCSSWVPIMSDDS